MPNRNSIESLSPRARALRAALAVTASVAVGGLSACAVSVAALDAAAPAADARDLAPAVDARVARDAVADAARVAPPDADAPVVDAHAAACDPDASAPTWSTAHERFCSVTLDEPRDAPRPAEEEAFCACALERFRTLCTPWGPFMPPAEASA